MFKLKVILILSLWHHISSSSKIITIDNFPKTESLNYEAKQIQHNVALNSIPLGNSSNSILGTGRVVSQENYICYDFETCNVISSRVISSHPKRSKRSIDDPGCHHQLFLEAFGTNMTLCLLEVAIHSESIFGDNFHRLNVTVFNKDNSSQEIPLNSLDIQLAEGYILEETFASVNGFILDGHFYGTVFLKDAVHFLEPLGRQSRDLHILGTTGSETKAFMLGKFHCIVRKENACFNAEENQGCLGSY